MAFDTDGNLHVASYPAEEVGGLRPRGPKAGELSRRWHVYLERGVCWQGDEAALRHREHRTHATNDGFIVEDRFGLDHWLSGSSGTKMTKTEIVNAREH